MIPAFQKALPVLKKIEQSGYEAFFVGGSVRDLFLEKEIHDVDIATSATPEEIKKIFARTVDVGIEHGTVVILYGGQSYEVTTFRSESEYEDFRRPNEVTFVRSLFEDLRRRDFTMNAIAMDINGKIIDPFNGINDIENRVIRTVGDPKDRFQEDALRMMRAVRFASQLAFSIDVATYKALEVHGQLLEHISVERKLIEFEKLLLGKKCKESLKISLKTGLYQYLPGFTQYKKGLDDFLNMRSDAVFSIEEQWILLLYHFQIRIAEVEKFLRKWKQPVKKIKRVKKGLHWLQYRLQNNWTVIDLYQAQEELVLSTEKLYMALLEKREDHVLKELEKKLSLLPIKKRRDLAVSGDDLIQWFNLKGGPWVEEWLLKIEEAVLQKEINNHKEYIREWLNKCNQN